MPHQISEKIESLLQQHQQPLKYRVFSGALRDNLLSLDSQDYRLVSMQEAIQERVNNTSGEYHDLWWRKNILTSAAIASAKNAEQIKFLKNARIFNSVNLESSFDRFNSTGFLLYGNNPEESRSNYNKLAEQEFFIGAKALDMQLSYERFISNDALKSLGLEDDLLLTYAEILKKKLTYGIGSYRYSHINTHPGFDFENIAHRSTKPYAVEFPLILQSNCSGSRISYVDDKKNVTVIGVPKSS